MAAKIYRINYKSDFILTMNSDAGWAIPFCIKFFTSVPSRAYYVGYDGETYTHCTYDPSEPTKLVVQFDDHHLPIGDLNCQIAYHFTVADFPNDTEDEVINPAAITTEIDGETYHVMLDFTGETAPEIEFSLPAYANEAERIQNELQRQQNEAARIEAELEREQASASAVAGAENVNAQLNGTTLTVTNRQGVSTSVNTKGEQGERGPVGPEGPQGEQGISIVDFSPKSQTETTLIYTVTFSDGHTQDVAIPKGPKGDTGATGPTGPQGPQGQTGVSITGFVETGETETTTLYNITFSNGTTQAVSIPKGEKGDQGPVGPEGPQGPMGDTAVITPEQQAAFTMYSTTGQNTNGPMTQKAVTDAIGNTAASGVSYSNSQSGLAADNVQDAIDELSESVDVSVSGTSAFERGQIDDSGKDSTASASYYIRTPADSPIPILNGQTMNLTFVYKNSSGTVLTGTTRIYRYLNGTFVSYSQTTGTSYSVVCDGTFNQLRVRFYRNNVGSLYPYCSVKYIVEKTLKEVAEQVNTNTADIASIAANLQGISSTVGSMEGQTINKRQYTSADLGSSYYALDNPYQTTASYSIYGGIKVPVKRGDHITLYTIGSSGAAKCWGLVDEYRKVLSRSSVTNYLTNPAEIDVTRDCYLCANVATTKSAEKAQFKLIITSNIQAQIEGAVSDLNALVKRAPHFCNNPFPFKGGVLRVLSLGNSFAEDTSAHLEGMMNAAGLDKSKFCYYFTFKSGATLAQYASDYEAGTSYSCIDKSGSYSTTPRAGTYSMPNSSGSLKKIVSQDWDLILLQQASTDAYEWSSYIPYITRLISYIKRDCPKACIGFMLTWATTYTGTTHAPSYAQRYEMNVNCAKKVLHEIGIDFIVAPGTAIQNARNTSLEDTDHLLRDSRHLNTGVGRYVAGCAFFDAVIAPFYGVSIIGNSYTTSAGTPVTDDNKLLCQQCGHAAVANMFEVTTGLAHDR